MRARVADRVERRCHGCFQRGLLGDAVHQEIVWRHQVGMVVMFGCGPIQLRTGSGRINRAVNAGQRACLQSTAEVSGARSYLR